MVKREKHGRKCWKHFRKKTGGKHIWKIKGNENEGDASCLCWLEFECSYANHPWKLPHTAGDCD